MKLSRSLLVLWIAVHFGGLALAQQPAPRGGGGRGTNTQTNPNNQNSTRAATLNEAADHLRALQDGVEARWNVRTGERQVLLSETGAAWWSDPNIVARLGLSEDQKLRLARAFENHRQNLSTNKDLLEKEEAQLSKLLDAETVDRGAVTTQIYKVVQARGEMEKTNALMTLEMREYLTRAQWSQLQGQQTTTIRVRTAGPLPAGGGRGGRGQQQ